LNYLPGLLKPISILQFVADASLNFLFSFLFLDFSSPFPVSILKIFSSCSLMILFFGGRLLVGGIFFLLLLLGLSKFCKFFLLH